MTQKRRLAVVDHSATETGDPLSSPSNNHADLLEDSGGRDFPSAPESPQQLFETLDGTELWARGLEWRVEVFSVLPDRATTWLQLRLTGESDHMVTLKLRAGESAAMAIALLTSWLAQPAPMPQILTGG